MSNYTWSVQPAIGCEGGGAGGAGHQAPPCVGRGTLRVPLHGRGGQGGDGGQGLVPAAGESWLLGLSLKFGGLLKLLFQNSITYFLVNQSLI